MPHYRYEAKDWTGEVHRGTMKAPSRFDLHTHLAQRHLRATRVVDISGIVDDPEEESEEEPEAPVVQAPPRWPVAAFGGLLVLLYVSVAVSWLPLGRRATLLLVPAEALLSLAGLALWAAAFPGPVFVRGLGLSPRVLEPLKEAPRWLHGALWLGALGAGAHLGVLALGEPVEPGPDLFLRLLGGLGIAVPVLVIGSGLAAALSRLKS